MHFSVSHNINHLSKERGDATNPKFELSICQIKCHLILSLAPCLCLCLMFVSSQGYESNTQLLPPYITAYSQFVESTESMDKINVPVTSLIKSKIPVAFVIHCFVSLSLITGPRFHH